MGPGAVMIALVAILKPRVPVKGCQRLDVSGTVRCMPSLACSKAEYCYVMPLHFLRERLSLKYVEGTGINACMHMRIAQ